MTLTLMFEKNQTVYVGITIRKVKIYEYKGEWYASIIGVIAILHKHFIVLFWVSLTQIV